MSRTNGDDDVAAIEPSSRIHAKARAAAVELLKLPTDNSPLIDTLSMLPLVDLLKYQKINKTWRDLCKRAIDRKRPGPPKPFQSNQELCDAVRKYCTYDPEAMEELACTYGYPIGKWDVSPVTDFSHVFADQRDFNEYIGDWDVSNTTSMVSSPMLCFGMQHPSTSL